MKPVLFYLAGVIIISGILYGYYHFFLRNKKFHNYNRYYLLSAVVISIVIPFLNIPIYFSHQQTEPSTLLHTLTVISGGSFEEGLAAGKHSNSLLKKFTLNNITSLIYFAAAIFLLIRFIAGLLKIARLKRIYTVEKIDSIDFINTNEEGTPFSFFRNLFWNKKIPLDSENGQQIFRHELFHIQQRHSIDIIFTEIIAVLYCMNPFFFLIKKEIKTIHEFLADSFAVNKNQEWNYAELLLMQVLGSPNNRLTNHFFHNQIKRRIAMITSSQKTSYQYMRKLLVLPVAVVITALFAFKYKAKESPNIINGHLEKTIVVVIDAGHGDAEPGVIAPDGTKESDITLQLAKKVKELNKNDRIQIVLTRETKDIVDLKKRTEIANAQSPDMFISLHVNSADAEENKSGDNASGFEVYISKKNGVYYSENKILGAILLNYFSNIYAITNKIRQRDEGIWVLDASKCPSALIECGYITNKKDLEFIKKSQNQDKIAQSILNSIEQFATQKESPDFNDKKKQVADTTKPVVLLSKDVNGKIAATINGITVNDLVMNSKKQVIGFILDSKSVVVIPKEDLTSIENKYGSLWNEYYDSFNNADAGKTFTTTFDQPPPASSEKVSTTISSSEKSKKPSTITFTSTEVDPSFPGGSAGWRTYLQKNLNANTPVDSGAKDGSYTVWVQFLVAQDGTVSNIKALTKNGFGTEEEVIKLIKNGPKWIPAMQNGKKVTAYKKQPVTFIVQEEKTGG